MLHLSSLTSGFPHKPSHGHGPRGVWEATGTRFKWGACFSLMSVSLDVVPATWPGRCLCTFQAPWFRVKSASDAVLGTGAGGEGRPRTGI